MGGGAGIEFTLDMEGARVRWNPREKKFKFLKGQLPEIRQFSAWGYQDGMGHVIGDLFKVVSADLPEENPADIKHAGLWTGDHYVSFQGAPKFMIFSGYLRGDPLDCFPITTNEVDVSIIGSFLTTCTITVKPRLPKTFVRWYNGVFNWFPPSENPTIAETQYNRHRNQLHERFSSIE